MSRPNPISKNRIPYVEAEPYGVDIAITGIQNAMSRIDWLKTDDISKSFGRANIMSRIDDDQTIVFPVCKVASGRDDLEMIGLDAFKAYSFMVARGSDAVEEFSEFDNSQTIRRIDLIVWMDLKRVGDDNTERLKQDVLEQISNVRFNEQSGGLVTGLHLVEIFDQAEDIFEGFTTSLEQTQMLYYPRQAFRFAINAYIDMPCLPTISSDTGTGIE